MNSLIRFTNRIESFNQRSIAFLLAIFICTVVGVLIGLDYWFVAPFIVVILIFLISLKSPIVLVWILIVVTIADQIFIIEGFDLPSSIIPFTVMAFIIANRVLLSRSARIKSFLDAPILVLIALNIIYSYGALKSDLLRIWAFNTAIYLIYFFLFDVIVKSNKLWPTIWVFIIANSFVMLISVLAVLGEINVNSITGGEISTVSGEYARLVGLNSNPNYFVILTLFCSAILIFMISKYNHHKRFFILWLIILNLIGAAITQSRAAIIGFIAGLVFVTFRDVKRHAFRLISLTVVMISILFYSERVSGLDLTARFTPGYLEETEQIGETARIDLFRAGLKIFLSNPIGHGYGSMLDLMAKYFGVRISSHNLFLTYAIEQGIFGLVTWIWLAWLTLSKLWNILKSKQIDPETRYLGMGFFTIMITIWVNFLAHSFVTWIPLWIILSLLAAFVYQVEHKQEISLN